MVSNSDIAEQKWHCFTRVQGLQTSEACLSQSDSGHFWHCYQSEALLTKSDLVEQVWVIGTAVKWLKDFNIEKIANSFFVI